MTKIIGINGQPLGDEKARAVLSVAPPDTADRELLSKVAEVGMIMIPVGVLQPPPMQHAFIRAILGGWICLVDMVYQPMPPMVEPTLQRVYRIEPAGRARLVELSAKTGG